MSIYIYADESGVFDPKHQTHYVFGGLLFLSASSMHSERRKYYNAEQKLRPHTQCLQHEEMKATKLSLKHRKSLYRSLNATYKFTSVIELARIRDDILANKKTKQRFLDYAFKRGLKTLLSKLMEEGEIPSNFSESIYVFMDEHTTATDGRYELHESLEKEFKIGVHTNNFSHYLPPLFPNMDKVKVEMGDSRHETLIRAADIVANHAYFLSKTGKVVELERKMCTTILP